MPENDTTTTTPTTPTIPPAQDGAEPVAPRLDPETFDLDAWIDGVKPLRQTVTLYQRGDLMPAIDDLVERMSAMKPDTAPDRALGEAGEYEQLRAELKAAWEAYEASGLVFELEAVSAPGLEEATREVHQLHPAAEDMTPEEEEGLNLARNAALGAAILRRSLVGVGPADGPRVPISPEQLDRLSARFPVHEFSRLGQAAESLTFTGQVSVPFSRRVSELLAESTSD